jgi:hypothetical protein
MANFHSRELFQNEKKIKLKKFQKSQVENLRRRIFFQNFGLKRGFENFELEFFLAGT